MTLHNVSEKDSKDVLDKLQANSGTGPDHLPARILKFCSAAIARPVHLLTLCILTPGVWPKSWREHWVAPLFKKKSVGSHV